MLNTIERRIQPEKEFCDILIESFFSDFVVDDTNVPRPFLYGVLGITFPGEATLWGVLGLGGTSIIESSLN